MDNEIKLTLDPNAALGAAAARNGLFFQRHNFLNLYLLTAYYRLPRFIAFLSRRRR